jgi:head-tail adaptor
MSSAGRRNRLVTIQRPVTTRSATGSTSVVWQDFKTVFGYKSDKGSASEKTHSSTLYPVKSVQWVIRQTEGVTPAMRLIYENEVWEIIAVNDSTYNRVELNLICELRGLQDDLPQASCPSLCEQIEDAQVAEIIGCLSELQEDEIKELLCEFPVIRARSTDGVYEAFELTSYPAGGNADLLEITVLQSDNTVFGVYPLRQFLRFQSLQVEDFIVFPNNIQLVPVLFNILNSDGFNLKTVNSYQNQAQLTLPDIPLLDDNGAVDDYPTPTSIVVDGVVNSASYASGVLTIEPASAPASVIPNRVIPNFSSIIDFTGDLAWQWANGIFDYNDGAGVVQELDPTAGAEYFFTLKHNNQFGNKFRFTDDQGVSAPLGRFDFSGDIITPNSTGATPGYFIDHLTGLGWTTYPVAATKNYTDSLSLCASVVVGVYNDFRMPSAVELRTLSFGDGLIYIVNVGTLPFSRQGLFSFDPTGIGSISIIWYSQSYQSGTRGGTLSNFRLRTSDAPLTATTSYGTYGVRKHF